MPRQVCEIDGCDRIADIYAHLCRRHYLAQYRDWRRSQGLCINCGKPQGPDSRSYCPDCRLHYNGINKLNYYKRKERKVHDGDMRSMRSAAAGIK